MSTEPGPCVTVVKHDFHTNVYLAPPANRAVTKAELNQIKAKFKCSDDELIVPTPPLCKRTLSAGVLAALGLAFVMFMLFTRR